MKFHLNNTRQNLDKISSKDVYILGDGGYARELRSALIMQTSSQLNVHLIKLEDEKDVPQNSTSFIGTGTPESRFAIFTNNKKVLSFKKFVSRSADIGEEVKIQTGAHISSGCILTTGIFVGEGVLLNLNSTVGHDAFIGAFSVINPGATISGGVTIGERVLVGANATILQNIRIGDGAIIGAGAVVTRNVVPGTTVVGVPAQLIS